MYASEVHANVKFAYGLGAKKQEGGQAINRITNLQIFLLGMFSMLLYSTFVANFSSAIQSF